MAETELNEIEVVEEPRRLRWDWLLPVFFRPGRTMHTVSQQEKGVWLAPLLVLSLLALVVSLAGGPARAAAQPSGELPTRSCSKKRVLCTALLNYAGTSSLLKTAWASTILKNRCVFWPPLPIWPVRRS